MLRLVIVMTLLASSILVNATNLATIQLNPVRTPTIDSVEEIDIEELEPQDIVELIRKYEQLPEVESPPSRGYWILWAMGHSWQFCDTTVTDEADLETHPMGMRLYIKAVRITRLGTIFKVVRGTIKNKGESHGVEGFGFVTKEGTLIMLLEGDDTQLITLGRVYQWGHFKLVALKGSMWINSEVFRFTMKGIAFRVPFWSNTKDPFPVNEADPN